MVRPTDQEMTVTEKMVRYLWVMREGARHATPHRATWGKHQSGLRGRGTEGKVWAFIVFYVDEIGKAVK